MGKSILVIEDDENIQDIFRLALGFEGYTVTTASNGQEGLEALKEGPLPFLILVDLMMPVMDGWTFMEELQKLPAYAAIPVVVITAFTTHDKPDRADKILRKPVELDLLYAVAKEYAGTAV